MLYWETADQDRSLDDAELEWAALWNPLPKVVFSTTLPAVEGHARLASGGVAEEIQRLRAEPGESEIAIGGATLAAEATALDLIDEYRVMVYPVLVGGGIPYFPRHERRVDLELVDTRTYGSRIRLPPLPRGEVADPSAALATTVESWQGSCFGQDWRPRTDAKRPARRSHPIGVHRVVLTAEATV
jgi:hypothetical protein